MKPDTNAMSWPARWSRRMAQAPLRAYRYALSPLLPMACRFEPSCARYAIEAIELHGPLKGAALGTRRILRCHPITWLGGGEGYDPVPEPHDHTHIRAARSSAPQS